MDEDTKRLLKKKLSTLNHVPKRTPNVEHVMEHSNEACSKQGQKTGGVWNKMEQGLEQEKCQNGTVPPDLEKWHPTPRYLLAEMERAGHRREDVRHIVWLAWVNATAADVTVGRIQNGAPCNRI